MDELRAIELLQEVMMGKDKQKLPLNSVRQRRAARKSQVPPTPAACKPKRAVEVTQQSTLPKAMRKEPANYVSDDNDTATTAEMESDSEWDSEAVDEPSIATLRRRSSRIQSQRQPDEHDALHRIVVLAAKETATVPELAAHKRKLTMGYHCANLSLQLDK